MSGLSRAACLVAATAAVGMGAWTLAMHGSTGTSLVYQEAREQELAKRKDLASEVSHTYVLGDEFALNGVHVDDESFGDTYLSTLGWVGEMRLRVSQFEVYSTARDTGISELADYQPHLPHLYDSCYVVVTIEVHNISAVPDDSRFDGTDILDPQFNIYGSRYYEKLSSSENLGEPDAVYSDLIFNSLEAEQDVINSRAPIELPVGESRTIRACFEVEVYENIDGERAAPCSLYFGSAREVGYCRVDLGEVGVA